MKPYFLFFIISVLFYGCNQSIDEYHPQKITYLKLYQEAESYIFTKPDSTQIIGEEIINLGQINDEKRWELNGLYFISRANLMLDDYNKGDSIAEVGITLAKEAGEWDILARFYHLQGILVYYQTDFDRATIILEKGLEVSQMYSEYNDMLSQEQLRSSIAMVQSQQGYYEQALKTYYESIKESGADTLNSLTSNLYSKVGYVYDKKGQYNEALNWHLRAIAIAEHDSVKYDFGVGTSSIFAATALFLMDSIHEAEVYAQNAYDILQDIDYVHATQSRLLLARIADKKGNLEKASTIGKEILGSLALKPNIILKTETLNFLSKVKIRNNQLLDAKSYLDSAYQIVQQTKERPQLVNVYENYANYYEEKKDISKAYLFFQQYESLKDSLDNESDLVKIEDLRLSFEKDIELKTKDAKIQLLSVQNQFRFWALLIISIASIFLGIAVLKIRNQNKALNKSNKNLETANNKLQLTQAQLYDEHQKVLGERKIEKERLLATKGELAAYHKRLEVIHFTNFLIQGNEIILIQSQGNYVDIYHRNGRTTVRGTLAEVEKKLPIGFFKTNRSFIVNLEQVRNFDVKKKEVMMSNGEAVKISKDKIEPFITELKQY